jgi:hypothetical protein
MSRAVIIDHGWMRIKTQVAELKGQGVKVGIRSTAGSHDGVRIVDYAVWNEFGTEDGHVPSRPFMRRTADQARTYLPNFMKGIVKGVVENRISVDQSMARLGLLYQSKIREMILASPTWAKPNAPSTIKAKGSSVPLVDTGAMVGAVDYERIKL